MSEQQPVPAEKLPGNFRELPDEPVNPSVPKRTAQCWADEIRSVIRQAEEDGYAVWADTTPPPPFNHRTWLKVGTMDGPEDADPVAWEAGQ